LHVAEIVRRSSTKIDRLAKLDTARRASDAKVSIARKAKASDEDLVPLMRERLDAWRAWGIALGEPESKAESGRKGGQAVNEIHSLDDTERKDRELARKIAAVPEPIFDARRARRWRGCDIDPAFASTELEAA
jgi:hypothetical protein